MAYLKRVKIYENNFDSNTENFEPSPKRNATLSKGREHEEGKIMHIAAGKAVLLYGFCLKYKFRSLLKNFIEKWCEKVALYENNTKTPHRPNNFCTACMVSGKSYQ